MSYVMMNRAVRKGRRVWISMYLDKLRVKGCLCCSCSNAGVCEGLKKISKICESHAPQAVAITRCADFVLGPSSPSENIQRACARYRKGVKNGQGGKSRGSKRKKEIR